MNMNSDDPVVYYVPCGGVHYEVTGILKGLDWVECGSGVEGF